MNGLIIKKEWLEQIFKAYAPYGCNKTWEIRRNNTSYRGKFYLLESGSKLIVGEAELVDSIKLTKDIWLENFINHQVMDYYAYKELGIVKCCPWDILTIKYPNPHAWIFQNICKYDSPIPYKHPQGAVIWVKDVKNLVLSDLP